MILKYLHLEHIGHQCVTVGAAASAVDWNDLPARGCRKLHCGKLNEIVLAGAGLEDDFGWCVRFIFVVVDVEADVPDADSFDEVDCKLVRLRTIGSVLSSAKACITFLNGSSDERTANRFSSCRREAGRRRFPAYGC